MTPDEQRALDYQAQERRRKEFKRSLQAKLKAPGEPGLTTKKNWEPVREVNA